MAAEAANLHALPASDAGRLLRSGAIDAAALVEACLAQVREVDARVQAWAFLDPDHARAQAKAADEWRLSGRPVGPLHGVPVGVKDIIDTADMPTEPGTVLHAGRTPPRGPRGRPGRGGRRRHGPARARQPDQRLDHPAGRVLRRLRLQADARPDPAPRHAPRVRAARPPRGVRG